MKRLSKLLGFIFFLFAALPAAAGGKVEICHFSPGGTGAKALTVGVEAAEWHIRKLGYFPVMRESMKHHMLVPFALAGMAISPDQSIPGGGIP